VVNPVEKEPSHCLWNVTKLKTLPEDYDLARTSRFITNTNVSTICSRIVTCLRNLGVVIDYDSEEAVVRCETQYFVKLCINLYRGKGNFSHGIIVEVKRTLGGCIEFMADCRAILKAAEGKSTNEENKFVPRKSISEMECLKNCNEILRNASKYVDEALECSEKYLQDERDDMKMLGLSSVNSLLDEKTCSCDTLKCVYKSVFTGEINPGIRKSIMSFLKKDFDAKTSDEYRRKLHNMSLQVIYKALYTCRTICREGFIRAIKENPWLIDSLTKILVEDIKNFKLYPPDALAALKCLNEMIPLSEDVKEQALSSGVLGASEEAYKIGKMYCAKVTSECETILRVLACK